MKNILNQFKNQRANLLWYKFVEYTGILDLVHFDSRLMYAKFGIEEFRNTGVLPINYINFHETRASRIKFFEILLHSSLFLYLYIEGLLITFWILPYLFFLLIPWFLIMSVIFSTTSKNSRKNLIKFLRNDSFINQLFEIPINSGQIFKVISEDFQNIKLTKQPFLAIERSFNDLENQIKIKSNNILELIMWQSINQKKNLTLIKRNTEVIIDNLLSLNDTTSSCQIEVLELRSSLQVAKKNGNDLGSDYIQKTVFVEFDENTARSLYDGLEKFFDKDDHELLMNSLKGNEINKKLFFNGTTVRLCGIFNRVFKSDYTLQFKENIINYIIANYTFNKVGKSVSCKYNTVKKNLTLKIKE